MCVFDFDRHTCRQTDRQTDTFLVASPRWHSMQRRNIEVVRVSCQGTKL